MSFKRSATSSAGLSHIGAAQTSQGGGLGSEVSRAHLPTFILTEEDALLEADFINGQRSRGGGATMTPTVTTSRGVFQPQLWTVDGGDEDAEEAERERGEETTETVQEQSKR